MVWHSGNSQRRDTLAPERGNLLNRDRVMDRAWWKRSMQGFIRGRRLGEGFRLEIE